MFWILLFIFLTLLLASEIQFRWKFRSLNKYPGPISVPMLGAIIYFFSEGMMIRNMFRLTRYYGNISRITILRQMCLLISDPDMLEFFLRTPKYTSKADNYFYLEPWLGKGTFLLSGREGQKMRKSHTPAFHFNIMESHVAVFNTHCDVLIDVLRENVDSLHSINIYPKIGHFTLDIITETAAGVKSNVQKNANEEFFTAMHFMTNIVFQRSLSLWKRHNFLFYLSPQYKQQQKYLKILENVSIKAIEERQKILRKPIENSDEPNPESKGNIKSNILLDILLTSSLDGKPIDNKIIKTEINGFLFAGHDTTASTISLMIYALANHKEIQDKIVAELKDIFGNDCDRPVEMQDLVEMRYMELVIKEVLRYYGIVPFIGRKVTEDVNYNGTIIPKETTLIFFLYGIHRSPSLYENHKEFIPERFITSECKKPYSFVPFSAGPKNCLGQKYAINEVKVTFAKLLRHFEFESAGSDHKLELRAEMVMKPINGIYVKIKSRKF